MLALSVILAAIENDEDREIIAAFFKKYKNYALAIAYSFLHNQQQAEDAVQGAFVRIVNEPRRVLDYEETSAKHYLAGMVRDLSKNIIRQEKRERKMPPEDINEALSEERFLKDMENEPVQEIMDAMEFLNDTDRSITHLHYIYGYPTKEIAQMLKMSDAAVRKRLQRARQKLHDIVKGEQKEAAYE